MSKSKITRKKKPVKRVKSQKTAKKGKRVVKGKKKAAKKAAKRKRKSRGNSKTKRERELEKALKTAREEARYNKAWGKFLDRGNRIREKSMSRHIPTADEEGFIPINYEDLTPQQRAWNTRRENEYIKAGMSYLSARDYASLNRDEAKWLDDLAWNVWGPYVFEPDTRTRQKFFERAFELQDDRVKLFLTACESMGFSTRVARTALFSPRPIKIGIAS